MSLAWEREVRMAALNAAVRRFNGVTVKAEQILETANQFERWILGPPENEDRIYIINSPREIWVSNNPDDPPPDYTGATISVGDMLHPHEHIPVQHRDFKEKWCNYCRRNKYGEHPVILQAKE